MSGSVEFLPARGHYLAHEVGQLAGVSGLTIGQWARRGYIRSSQSDGSPRRYSFQDVAEAILVHELIERGVSHKQIRSTIQRLRERYGYDWPLTHGNLATAGGRIVAEPSGAVAYDVGDRGWQQTHIDERDLDRVVDLLSRGGWAARSLPNLAHIEVNPRRMSGRPVIRGTRVPAQLAAELADRPGGRATLRAGYGLTRVQIADAEAWWRKAKEFDKAAA